MKDKKRKNIPSLIKEDIRRRDNYQCICCVSKINLEFHHFNPIALKGSIFDFNNIVLLCKEHHKLLHLGDLDTITSVYEYVYFLNKGELPEDLSEFYKIMNNLHETY